MRPGGLDFDGSDGRLVVLGSRSPRRRELLEACIPTGRILVRPPTDADEAGFDDCRDWPAIRERLLEITWTKSADVTSRTEESGIVLTADTVIVAERSNGVPIVLGKPPEEEWRDVVRSWFLDLYLGRTHRAATAVVLVDDLGHSAELCIRTDVTFASVDEELVEWYLDTGEPRGKAGGYAIQDRGRVFVDRIEGSLTNVVGLPVVETREALLDMFAQRDGSA